MTKFTVLAVGATGSIGRYVVSESLRRGHQTRTLVREAAQEASMPTDVEIVVDDLTSAGTLAAACCSPIHHGMRPCVKGSQEFVRAFRSSALLQMKARLDEFLIGS
jgi:nucleoside-diphosphate-sugar epimerase